MVFGRPEGRGVRLPKLLTVLVLLLQPSTATSPGSVCAGCGAGSETESERDRIKKTESDNNSGSALCIEMYPPHARRPIRNRIICECANVCFTYDVAKHIRMHAMPSFSVAPTYLHHIIYACHSMCSRPSEQFYY